MPKPLFKSSTRRRITRFFAPALSRAALIKYGSIWQLQAIPFWGTVSTEALRPKGFISTLTG